MKNDKVYLPEAPSNPKPKVRWTEEQIIREVFNHYEGRDRVGLEQFVRKLIKGEIKADT